ncbi:MAG: flavin reductase [Clostridia bacterium]|nr:flavin reductase [Clostridia bacterium]
MEGFIEISAEELESSAKLIGKDWMLVTAGSLSEGYNTMTASWGCMGVLWNKPVSIAYIRPQRFTYLFAEANEYMTMCFFDEDKRDALRFCGSHSGRDCDKVKECGLTPIETDVGKGIIFCESKLALICRKLYVSDIKEEGFVDEKLLSNYAQKDYHRQYICEIVKAYKRV